MPNDRLLERLKKADSEEIKEKASKMSDEQIGELVAAFDKKRERRWKEKSKAIISGLNRRKQLEAAGKKISASQFLCLIDVLSGQRNKWLWKLSPLLVGMPHETFFAIIRQATNKQLDILRHESVTEPIQHHLTIMTHKMEVEIERLAEEIHLLDMEIENIDPTELKKEDLSRMREKILLLTNRCRDLFGTTNRALSLAWNARRSDIIEGLNKIKNSCRNYIFWGLGFPGSKRKTTTGLWTKLDKKIFSVFGDSDNPADFEALRDEEPVTEGLNRLSIWYLKDYWQLGLIPSVKKIADINIDIKKHDERERRKIRERLFKEARKNLNRLGLKKVRDLKDNYIFSRETLWEYLNRRRESPS